MRILVLCEWLHPMANDRLQLDPEKFVIGEGCYTNQCSAMATANDHELVIRPYPLKQVVIGVAITNALMALVFGVIGWIHAWVRKSVPFDTDFFQLMVPVVGILTCIGYTVITLYTAIKEKERGPVLVFNKSTEEVTLPRDGVRLSSNQVMHLQYITTKRLQTGSIINNDRMSELNLIAMVDGQRKRFPLLRLIGATNDFSYIVQPVLQHTTLDVVRITDTLYGWDVTETSMRHDSRTT